MFDAQKLVACLERHPISGRAVTQFEVSLGSQLTTSLIWKLLKGNNPNPSIDTVCRLAKYFYGDHKRVGEFVLDEPPRDRSVEHAPMPVKKVTQKKAKKARA